MAHNKNIQAALFNDKIFAVFIRTVGVLVLGFMLYIFFYLVFSTFPAILDVAAYSQIPIYLFGTFKGVLIALIIAIPISIFSAIYLFLYASHRTRKVFLFVVDLLSYMPSIILGYFAYVWLAPMFSKYFGLLTYFIALAIMFPFIFKFALKSKEKEIRTYNHLGYVSVLFLCFIFILIFILFHEYRFVSNFSIYVSDVFKINYEINNSVVVGFTLAFFVSPTVFIVTFRTFEILDRNLMEAALSLGANKSEYFKRIIIPFSKRGIIAAVLLGSSKAVGETVIFLLAAGNMDIIDANPFTGMSAITTNILVQIIEAPFKSQLYHTVFVYGFLLFSITFIINTYAAKLILEQGRKKYEV